MPRKIGSLNAPWPGHWTPLGATYHPGDDRRGEPSSTNFALWSPDAEWVELCLLDDAGNTETTVPLRNRTFDVWHGRIPGIEPGQRYGYRVHGAWEPDRGLRFDASALLVDPYARAVEEQWSVVVADDGFDWGDDRPPDVPWEQTLVYEAHVRGMTMRHPDVPAHLRGTYAGLAHPAVIEHLKSIGVTAIELLPVHQFADEPFLRDLGLSNYWGYNTLAFFAPHSRYSSSGTRGQQVTEFKQMVRAMHEAGIEVILDVVYNHTAEGGPDGPTLSFRGIANAQYYRLDPDDPSRYLDYTGTGNTLDVSNPPVLRMVMDSLRYWVGEMHVDGFRFDLASALARSMHDVDMLGSFMTVIEQDPMLREVKLIAEPWDVGPGGYQVGEFPHLWTEWNDKFRDTVRDFWRGHAGGVNDLAYRLSGSSDLYADDGRRPYASINFVTAHDGFTLRDLVSYDHKHNEANGQDNRDGHDDNRSWNHGIEGIAGDSDASVRALRRRQIGNFLTTLLLSTGVPMLAAGDEMGRTQRGNNNAYCHDDETTWVDWSLREEYADVLTLVQGLTRLRREHPVFRQRRFFEGQPIVAGGRKDIAWFAPSGREMTEADWHDGELATLGMYLSGDGFRSRTAHGERMVDDSFLLWLHAGADDIDLTLPGEPWASGYETILPTSGTIVSDPLRITGRSCHLLRALAD